jgi:hypothetical protein
MSIIHGKKRFNPNNIFWWNQGKYNGRTKCIARPGGCGLSEHCLSQERRNGHEIKNVINQKKFDVRPNFWGTKNFHGENISA